MGEIIRYHCTCGYDVELSVGSGLNARNKNIIQSIFSEEELREFLSLDEVKGLISYELRNELAVCQTCKQLITVPCLHYRIESEEECSMLGKCPQCMNEVSILSEMEDVLCPHCENHMKMDKVGYWD